jgi:Mrp family chromosome partitioning ATPase
VEPIEYVRALIRRWPIIAVAAFIGAAFAFIGTEAEPEPVTSTYTAAHTVLVSTPEFGQQSLVGTTSFAQIPVFATTGEVPRAVAEQLDYGGPPAALAAELIVESDSETGTVRFTTEQPDPQEAVRIADAFAEETVRYLSQRQEDLRQERLSNALADVERLEDEIQQLDQQISDELAVLVADLPENAPTPETDSVVRAQRDTAVVEYSVAYEAYRSLLTRETEDLTLTTLERAQPVRVDTGGFTPPRTRATRVPIAAGIGALLGAGVALLAERLDAKVRDRRKAEEAFGAGVVAELPSLNRKQRALRLVVGPKAHHAAAEAFRSLRTSITFMAAGGQPLADDDRVGVILVSSPGPGEGKTTIAANLAVAFAETGRSVVVVNSDFRRPVVSSILTDERPSLPAGLAGIDRLNATSYLSPTKIPGVQLLDLSPLGGTPGDLTRATVRLISNLAEQVDVLIIDTPPLAVTTEALDFVPVSKVVVLVARIGRTASAVAQRAGELVRFGGAEHIAVALNDTGSSRLGRPSYYDYYGGRRRRRRQVQDPVVEAVAMDAEAAHPNGDDEWQDIDDLVHRQDQPGIGRAVESGDPTPSNPTEELPGTERTQRP